MGIEFTIMSMDDSVTKDIVLKTFSPYWTKIDDDEYELDYGDEIYEGKVVSNSCDLFLNFRDDKEQIIRSINIISPCSDPELDKAIFLLIQKYPMFFAAPDFPLMTANQKCMELLKTEDEETFEEMTFVESFEEFSGLLC